MSTQNNCRCFIHHPETEEGRKHVFDNLERSRALGDTQGIMIALSQLQPCPSMAKKKEKPKITIADKRQDLIEFNGDYASDDKDHLVALWQWTIQGLAMRDGWAKPTEEEIMDPRMMARIFVASLTDSEVEEEHMVFQEDDNE